MPRIQSYNQYPAPTRLSNPLRVSRVRRSLDRAYLSMSLLFVLALVAVVLVTVIQASPSVTSQGTGWFLSSGQTGTSYQQQGNDSPLQIPGEPDQIGFERRLLTLVNEARIARGLPPLRTSDGLTRAARLHSNDMAARQRLDSIDPTGRTPLLRAQSAGYAQPQFIVEDIGAGFSSPDSFVNALLANPASAANLMNGDANEIGVGYGFARQDQSFRHYWTIDLGKQSGLVFTVVVNNGAEATTASQVTLHIGGKGWAEQMKISNSPDYGSADWQPYREMVKWSLADGTGPKKIYVKLRGPAGQEVETIGVVALAPAAKGIKPGSPHDDTLPAPRPPVLRSPAADIGVSGTFTVPLTQPLALAVSNALAPGFYQTSEFMLGKVVVGIVTPQCNGAVDKCSETWTANMMDQVYSQVQAGTAWWVKRMNNQVSFVFDQQRQVATGYEPVNHSQADESMWIGDVMTHLGFKGSTYFEQVYAYNNWMRQKYGTDWAFTIFVANSLNNSSGTFSNGYFAYSYVPGPFSVTTYDNDGYSINNMASVIAHETGHIFGALDQYSGANVACTATSGYLVLQNQNSQQNCSSNEDSIMRGGVTPYSRNLVDAFALGMVGNRASKSNKLPDPINTTPIITLNPVPATTTNTKPTITGTAQDQPFPSPNGNSITINHIAQVHYRVDNGAWQEAKPSDGTLTFDKVSQGFAFTPELTTGTHWLEVQALNRVNNASAIVGAMITVQSTGPVPTPVPTQPAPTATPPPLPPTPSLPEIAPTASPGPLGDALVIPINAGNTAISLPYSSFTASSLIASINAQGGTVSEVDNWTGGNWQEYVGGGTGNDFQIQAGVGYVVKAKAASTWKVPLNAGGQARQIKIERGWTLLGIPQCRDGSQNCFTASTLAAAINAQDGGVVEIDHWINGSWSAYLVGYPFNDFAISVGEGYFIQSNRASNWVP
ncbi:MAG: CAP domain-containing protein [Acidobacteriota bacterium]